MAAAKETQREMVVSMSRMLDSEKGGGVKSALDVFQATIPALASSFLSPDPTGRASSSTIPENPCLLYGVEQAVVSPAAI
jgi:hypothetical protein